VNFSSHQQGGIPCPECQSFIPMSLEKVLGQRQFSCPSCGLQLTIDLNQSQQGMKVLQNIKQAQDQVREARPYQG
jgi:transcription elongation factor Elf1